MPVAPRLEPALPTFLTTLKGAPLPKLVVGFDCETYGTQNKFQFGYVSSIDGDDYYDDPREMLDTLGGYRYQGQLIYATNLAFDAFALFQAVAGPRQIPSGWEAFDNGSKLIWVKNRIRKEKSAATGNMTKRYQTLLDSLNLFPIGVYNLGEILQKVSRMYAKPGPLQDLKLARYYDERKLSMPAWIGKKQLHQLSTEELAAGKEYCAADARTTRKFMEWANGEIRKLGAKVKVTGASTAMDLFRRQYLANPIPQPRWECLVDSRFSYYGGRTEDFVKGTVGPIWDADVTAMYPASMVEIAFPYPSPERFVKRTSPHPSCLEHEGFASVRIRVPRMHIPPLPFKLKGKLLFPYGTLEGVWTHLELRHAISVGCVLEELKWSYWCEQTFNPFTEYVTDLIGKRLSYLCPDSCPKYQLSGVHCYEVGAKCDDSIATEEVIKLFLNGLYGKFAQNFLTEEEAAALDIITKHGGGTFKHISEATEEEIAYTSRYHADYLVEGWVVNAAIPKLKAFMNPILSSYVTARARVKLHEFFLMAESEGARVLYCDTDSIYTDKPLSFTVPGKELGKLQSGKRYKEILVVGPKAKRLLTEDGKVVVTFKGVPAKSFNMADPFDLDSFTPNKPREETFSGMESGKIATPKFTRFMKVREAFARDKQPNEMVEVAKEFNPFEFPKRRFIGIPKDHSTAVRALLSREFRSVPWEIDSKTQQVIGAPNL